jgi:hypothetical protein
VASLPRSITGAAGVINENLFLHGVGWSDRVRHCGNDFIGHDAADQQLKIERDEMNVLIHVDTSKQVGDKDHIKVFANQDAAETWFAENDPEGVAFEYGILK